MATSPLHFRKTGRTIYSTKQGLGAHSTKKLLYPWPSSVMTQNRKSSSFEFPPTSCIILRTSFSLNASRFFNMCINVYAALLIEPHKLPIISIARFYFLTPYSFFEEKPDGDQVHSLPNFSESKVCNGGYISSVGSGIVHRCGGIHSLAYRLRRPPHSRQEDRTPIALVRRLYDNIFSSRLHTRILKEAFISLIPLQFVMYAFMILMVLS